MDKRQKKILFFGILAPIATVLIAMYAIKKIADFNKKYEYLDKIYD